MKHHRFPRFLALTLTLLLIATMLPAQIFAPTAHAATGDITELPTANVSSNKKEIEENKTFTIQVAILPADATFKGVSFTSSVTNRATVDANGVVSVVIGRIERGALRVELWLMSCRVLKRDMEYAMMDALVTRCRSLGITKIIGYYYRTAKNAMVEDFYDKMKFTKQSEDSDGNSAWVLEIDNYRAKNTVIDVAG